MTNPTTPFSWQMPTASDLVTDLPADFEVFGQAVATSMADLLGGTTGQVLSKASNTNMDFTWVTTDDANAIQNSIVDAKGDLIGATANDTPARLAVGANGEALIADSTTSTGLKWGYPNAIGCALWNYDGAGTTVANNTNTVLSWNNEIFDSNGFHSTTTNTSRITIPTGLGGKYQFNASLLWALNATGGRTLQLRFNGGGTIYFGGQTPGSSSLYPASTITRIFNLNAGDYVELQAFQNSGGNLVAYNDEVRNAWFEAIYLGA
jgi:hypothetical protein